VPQTAAWHPQNDRALCSNGFATATEALWVATEERWEGKIIL